MKVRSQLFLLHAFREVPIIAVTARAMPEDREECLEAGADDFLTKSVDAPGLFSAMQKLLSPATA